jgi:DNA mismatch repair ATPase MutS
MLEEAMQIQSYLETTCSENPDEVIERIKDIGVCRSRTGMMLADAKKMYRLKRTSEITEKIVEIAKEGYLSAKIQNALVESIAVDEAYLVDLLDRLNASCTHEQDALRSILSYERESIRLNNTGY